jgi:serine/threonine protein kinase
MSEQSIFLAALDIADTAQRAAYVDSACAGDAVLRQQILALLAAHQRSGAFLNVPAVAQIAAGVSQPDDRPVEAPRGDENRNTLNFLQPPTKPGSVGRLGHYEVLQVLGQGGFGIVVNAFDDVLHRVVAIKVISEQMAATSPPRQRFLREARSAAAVRHENIVAIHDIQEQPIPYLVMEYIPGQTLQEKLDETGPLQLAEVLRLGQQVANGLAAAHALGLVHRDIKPSNILLESGIEQRVKITDFGLARAADDASLTQSGVIAGTPMYMSPEQAAGEHIDHRADLFSLGSVLYVMVSGRPPFRASTTMGVLKRVAEDTPRPIREIIPEVPEWLCAIIAKLHAKKPEERFQTAKEVADVLAKALAELQVRGGVIPLDSGRAGGESSLKTPSSGTTAPTSQATATSPSRFRRHWWKAAGVIVGVNLLANLLAWHFVPHLALIASNRAEIRIELDDANAQLVLSRNGKPVVTQDGTGAIKVLPGTYEVEIRPRPGRAVARISYFQQSLFFGRYVANDQPDIKELYVDRGDCLKLTVSFTDRDPAVLDDVNKAPAAAGPFVVLVGKGHPRHLKNGQ